MNATSDQAEPGTPRVEEPLPISLVAHQAFCPRRAWLEAMGERTDTRQMAVGVESHVATDDEARSRTRQLRAVDVASSEFGVVGRCDTVEIDDDGRATVIEHKATPVRRRPEVTEPTVVQLALQSAALTEAGFDVAGAAVRFPQHRTTVPVPIGPAEFLRARELVRQTAETITSLTAPEPLEDDRRCTRCSHAGVCLPDERTLRPTHRTVLVADPDGQVLHVTTPGARAFIRSGRVRIEKAGEQLGTVPIERVHALVLHGNIDVSGALLRELLWRRLPVVWCSGTGRVVGWASSAHAPNGGPRVRQHVASAEGRIDLARQFITAKIANQATLLRRHGDAPAAVDRMRTLQRNALAAASLNDLFGVEGEAAAQYFDHFASMLSPAVRDSEGIGLTTRTRRPATDPLNAALNLAYGLLLADVIRAVIACGLDPHAGFLHSSQRNKPALALDLAEEFRAPIADSAVIGAFNNGEVKTKDVSHVTGSCRLRDTGRTALIAAYERRVATTFTHPIFGYRVTWRRAMEVQARLVLGVIDGTQPSYRGIMIR